MQDIFRGRTVAFVGQAPNILGKKLGQEIDEHDIVYRTNIFPVPNPQDYGKRCDVISVLPRFKEQVKFIPVRNFILFEEMETGISQNKYVMTKEERKHIAAWALEGYQLDIISPTAGLIAFWMANKFEAKSIKFYGITGYQNKNGEVVDHDKAEHNNAWYKDYLNEDKEGVDMKNYKFHNFTAHNDLFRIMLAQDAIEMDQFSLEYFKPRV